MPRVAGQVDLAKRQAILKAASEVFAARGLHAPMEEIARQARVSKQTIYNHYGSKAELLRALIEMRVETMTAPLDMPGAAENPEVALAILGRQVLHGVLNQGANSLLRLAVQGTPDVSDLARAIYEAGLKASRARLAQFLTREGAAGRLAIDDAALAAEFFFGMVVGSHQTRFLLDVREAVSDAEVERITQAAAARFMRAYTP
ncbi:TetR/AcrR family transcriptional regulator [Phenylobacterium sp.]|uniref:TetR/AcrR family transcriptional regulator n=1 Tax=Phenylobacterium sp. TaxID=1871053 RepID=UPI0027352C93|nr:TetR/AcrR family transcriptional regulator [Phenylobacterium sp.]MDP3660913.1 TetR/AcrR family transcriptional regulator [Phenylobacterium sp.]